jgi:hypothetical protein
MSYITRLTPKASIRAVQAVRLAADSIAAIDQQVAAASAIRVDSTVLPALGSDLGALTRSLGQWPTQVRPVAVQALRETLTIDSAATAAWAKVDRTSPQALLAYAATLQQAMATSGGDVARLTTVMAPFRMAIDQSISRLQGDLGAVNSQLTTERALVSMLATQAQQQRDKISYYESHPWKLILDGLTIGGLIEDLQNISNAQSRANAALSRMALLEAQIQQLATAQGPLLGLSTALVGLSGGLSNIQTAVMQVTNTLNSIQQRPLLPAIMAGQLQGAVQDLTAADNMITDMLGGS